MDYSLLFAMIMVALYMPVQIAEQEMIAYSRYEIQYHEKLDNAIDDGLFDIVERDTYEEVVFNREEVLERFYRSFYGNFGVPNTSLAKTRIRQHLPLIGIVDQNKISIAYQKPVQKDGQWELVDAWTDDAFYEYQEGGILYQFQLGSAKDKVRVLFYGQTTWIEGLRKDLAQQDSRLYWLSDDKRFEQIRRNTILTVLKEQMMQISNFYNSIGNQWGFQYEFYLPDVEQETWCRTIDDIGMVVLFQGYPVEGTLGKTYTRFVYSGARTYKKSKLEQSQFLS